MRIKTCWLFVLIVCLGLLAACRGGSRGVEPQKPAATPAVTPASMTPVAAPTQPATSAASTPAIPPTTGVPATLPAPLPFDGQRALEDVKYQMDLGPRLPGSPAHAQAVAWMMKELEAAGWRVTVQETTLMGQPVRNVVAEWGQGHPWVLLGAHYDSRLQADQDLDPAKRDQPVPAANDGASGVGLLLELARTIPSHLADDRRVTLLFIDAEDNGELPGWDWLLGSKAYAARLTEKPDAVVIVDMIGDADLNIYQELNSDPTLTQEIWDTAARLGYGDKIIAQPKYRMVDDHIPFIQAGIRAVDMIDFDYPYWHTTEDTLDKVSAESLQVVGDTLLAWLPGFRVP